MSQDTRTYTIPLFLKFSIAILSLGLLLCFLVYSELRDIKMGLGAAAGLYLFYKVFRFKIIVNNEGILFEGYLLQFSSQQNFLRWRDIRCVTDVFYDLGISITRSQEELHRFRLVPKDPKAKPVGFSGSIINIRGLLQDIVTHLPPDAQVDPNVIKFINSPYDKWEYLKITAWIVGIFMVLLCAGIWIHITP